jgi:hypothetical protein
MNPEARAEQAIWASPRLNNKEQAMTQSEYRLPSRLTKADGSPRQVGFELEFSGITLNRTGEVVQQSLKGRVTEQTEAEQVIECDGFGPFNIELDWAFLKRKAAEREEAGTEDEWLHRLSQAAELLVPVEVVCPPIPLAQMDSLDPLVKALREAGAQGTEESLIAAYGVHVNPEIPDRSATTLFNYLRAFALLQWWLVEAHQVNTARKISPYVGLYPEHYVCLLLSRKAPDIDQIFADYLTCNPTRNRALDLLPLLSDFDAERVQRAVDDPRINARPTFHYRLPNCQIEREGWSLAEAWNRWWVVESLAEQAQALDELGARFLASQKPLLGVKRKDWVEFIDRWLHDHGLA